jgi:farnesyl-diphosphate farnesyltransferase
MDAAARLDDLLVKTSRTFALSIPRLPEPLRREVTVAYLLFRIADTLEDATLWSAARKREELARLDALLAHPRRAPAAELAARWLAEPPLEHPGYLELLADVPAVLAAFEALAPGARALVGQHTRRTIERMAGFVERAAAGRQLELHDVPDLQAYCYAVAGIVGEMLTELFLLGSPVLAPVAPRLRANAARFGEALQLVNILKDARGDAAEGRRYLPARVERAEVFAIARGDLAEASRYVRDLQQAGAAPGLVAFTALPVLLARATLDRVEGEGAGAKLTRAEVQRIAERLDAALERGVPVV